MSSWSFRRKNPKIKRRPKILSVDDNSINQLIISQTLESLGISCRTVTGGLPALEALRTGDFDLVLMDLHMPEMDGFMACQAIRGSPSEFQAIPVIALTASDSDMERQRCFDVGMNDFIPKPLNKEILVSTLRRWLT